MAAWVIGNWKQNPVTVNEVNELLDDLTDSLTDKSQQMPLPHCQVMVMPSLLHLPLAQAKLADTPWLLGAQDVSAYGETKGAYTGDCSAAQLKDMGVSWVLVGHSERRQYHHENNEILQQKISHALKQGLGVIFCVGETQAQYEAKQTAQVLTEQLTVIKSAIINLANNHPDIIESVDFANLNQRVLIAYEPVWAIGTGKIPLVEEVTAIHTHIKNFFKDFEGDVHTQGGEVRNSDVQVADKPKVKFSLNNPTVLYGGSVNADNAAQFAKVKQIDGALVGGASLTADSFLAIADAFGNKP